jgi:hypothetical protein
MSKTDGVFSSILAQAPLFADHVDRCKVVHTPVGIEALVPEPMVRERYGKVYAAYNRIRSVLASDCNEYLPFYRLHDDMVVEIWDYLSVVDRHNIAMVSRRFRSIALNTAHLWTFINFDNFRSVPQTRTLLKRAGTAPLHLRVNNNLAVMPPLLSPPFPGLPPTPPPAPFKPLPSQSDLIASIPKAAVLDAFVFRKDSSPPDPPHFHAGTRLKLEALTMPMPLLRSLRLSMQPVHPFGMQPATPNITDPLFSGHTPLLSHVAVVQCNLALSDPIFVNLTYLLIRRPDNPFDLSRLVVVLRASPSLTYLGLEAAIAPTSLDTTTLSVELPALQRLYIADRDTWRVIAALRHIKTPNVLECDFTSPDATWFDGHTTTGTSPFSHLHATQEVTLTVAEKYTHRFIIECRWDAKYAVRFHLDPTFMNYYVPTAGRRDHEDETFRITDTLRGSPILFGQVRSLTLRGGFSIKTLTQILWLFASIERLSTRYLTPPRKDMFGVADSTKLFSILSSNYCRQLRAIDIGDWPELTPWGLHNWVSARWGGEDGCSRLKEVMVSSEKPLPSEARYCISVMLDKFLWRKPKPPKPVYNPYMGCWRTPPSFSAFPATLPTSSPPSDVSTQVVEDGSWDEDDEDNEPARVSDLIGPLPPNTSVEDDTTLIYCDPALRTRWDYFAIPGM